MIIATIIPQIPGVGSEYAILFTYGPMGAMLIWFMLRVEQVFAKISDLAHRIDGLTRAMLVDMVERESSGEKTKEYARDAIARIDARAQSEDRRKKRD